MAKKQYDLISNICILVVVLCALISDAYPEYRVVLGSLACIAAVASMSNYFKNLWREKAKANFSHSSDNLVVKTVIHQVVSEEENAKILVDIKEAQRVFIRYYTRPIYSRMLLRNYAAKSEAEEELAKYMHEYMRHMVNGANSSAVLSEFTKPIAASKIKYKNKTSQPIQDSDLVCAI